MTNRLIRDDEEKPIAPASAPEPPPPAKPRSFGRGPYGARRRQVTAHIDPQLFRWLKTIHVQTEKPMVEIFAEALAEYVQRYAVQKKLR